MPELKLCLDLYQNRCCADMPTISVWYAEGSAWLHFKDSLEIHCPSLSGRNEFGRALSGLHGRGSCLCLCGAESLAGNPYVCLIAA